MTVAQLILSFDSPEALRREYDANLRHGRAFVAGASGVERLATCLLQLERMDTSAVLELNAQVVLVADSGPMRGVALQMNEGPWREQLAEFVKDVIDEGAEGEQETTPEGGEEQDDDHDEQARPGLMDRRAQIRRMSLAERSRVAHGSSLEDRVLLERIFGSSVWEMLLRSGTLTPPEIANIARKGSLPTPLLEMVVDNAGWIRQDVVRRALLTNVRTPPHCVIKILQAAPKAEVKLITESAGSYPSRVRSVLLSLKGKRS
ncbi:MAG TPA: hypothetical protein VL137_08880 [Polyangiaceae bacterium]|nr:hypothetical protein [Polyangiaceae bacterium]